MLKRILLIILLLIIAYFIFIFFYRPKTKTIVIELGKSKYNFEIAKTIRQKAAGLSNRTSLCKNCGMIFVYSSENIYPFWMKDTLIPLDIIWLDKAGKIVTYHNALPEPKIPLTQLKTYKNTSPAQYIIEINSGDFDKLKLKLGDIINLPILND